MPRDHFLDFPARKKTRNQQFSNVVVCSSRIWLQHKASCYGGHGSSNRLNSLQGCTTVKPTRSDLQGGVHLVWECPIEAIRHAAAHPRLSREAIRRTKPYALRGLGPSPSRSCTVRGWPGSKSKYHSLSKEDTPFPGNQTV